MNKLETSLLGGHPLTLDDFTFLQEAVHDGFKALSNILSDPNNPSLEPSYIIKGCEKTLQSAGIWQINAGYIVISGEVCYVPQHTVSFSDEADPLYWIIEQSAVAPSPVEYRDLQLQEVHLQRIAKVSTTTSLLPFESTLTVRALLDRRQRRGSGTFTLINGWEGAVSYTIAHGRIHLHGFINCSSNTIQSLVAFNIPSALAPWGWGFDNYVGVMPSIESSQAGVLAIAYALSGGISFPCTRIHRFESTINSASCWPCHILPNNVTSAAPRVANFLVYQPQNIPSGSDTVVYNLSGISWNIAPE